MLRHVLYQTSPLHPLPLSITLYPMAILRLKFATRTVLLPSDEEVYSLSLVNPWRVWEEGRRNIPPIHFLHPSSLFICGSLWR